MFAYIRFGAIPQGILYNKRTARYLVKGKSYSFSGFGIRACDLYFLLRVEKFAIMLLENSNKDELSIEVNQSRVSDFINFTL